VSGQTFQSNDISEILRYEEELKTSCAQLRQIVEVIKTFGGEKIIEFTAEGAKTVSAKA
jgi:hypothetical protein